MLSKLFVFCMYTMPPLKDVIASNGDIPSFHDSQPSRIGSSKTHRSPSSALLALFLIRQIFRMKKQTIHFRYRQHGTARDPRKGFHVLDFEANGFAFI